MYSSGRQAFHREKKRKLSDDTSVSTFSDEFSENESYSSERSQIEFSTSTLDTTDSSEVPSSNEIPLTPNAAIAHSNNLAQEIDDLLAEVNGDPEIEELRKTNKVKSNEHLQIDGATKNGENEQIEANQQYPSTPTLPFNDTEVNETATERRNPNTKKQQRNQSMKENNPQLTQIETPPLNELPFIFQPQFFEVVTVSRIKDAARNDFHIAARCAHCIKSAQVSGNQFLKQKMSQKLIRGRTLSFSNFLRHLKTLHPNVYAKYNKSLSEFKKAQREKTKSGSVDLLKSLPVDQATFDSELLRFVIKTRQPLTLVENTYFNQFVNVISTGSRFAGDEQQKQQSQSTQLQTQPPHQQQQVQINQGKWDDFPQKNHLNDFSFFSDAAQTQPTQSQTHATQLQQHIEMNQGMWNQEKIFLQRGHLNN